MFYSVSLHLFFSGEIVSIILYFRFGRGIKTLNDLLKQALSGKAVSEEEIPPPVVTVAGKKSVEPDLPSSARSPPSKELPVPSRPAPPPPVSVQPPPVPPHPPLGVPLPGIVADDINNSTSQSPVELTGEGSKTLNMLKERQSQYKQAALQAKRAGNNTLAIQYVRTVKVLLINVKGRHPSRKCYRM